MLDIKNLLHKNNVVICGALRYSPHSTSDGTTAKIAQFLKTDFINITDVPGLFTKNPKEHKDAKLVPKISWKSFEKMAFSLKHEAGQHFILDQEASTIIKKHKIKTYIVGPNMNNLSKLLDGKKFIGTTISD